MLRTIFRKNLTLRYQNKIFYNISKMDKATEEVTDLTKMRVEYKPGSYLEEEHMEKNPFNEFKIWLKHCIDSKKIMEPNAMVICTATKDGFPNARPVLLKSFDENGFLFYTNYESQKSREMKENPNVCICFFWDALSRVVRIQGQAKMQTDPKVNDEYFHSRPRDAQIASFSSNQSGVVDGGRTKVEERFEEVKKKFEGVNEIPRPDCWGGWVIVPKYFEFWQGQTNRLHDRVVYKQSTENPEEWKIERLSP